MDKFDEVWNRAAGVDLSGVNAQPGDIALRDALVFHGSVCNGGLLNAVESYSEDEEFTLPNILSGYRFLGFEQAAETIAACLKEWQAASEADDDDLMERLEEEFDPQYALDDNDIEDAARKIAQENPSAFAPV